MSNRTLVELNHDYAPDSPWTTSSGGPDKRTTDERLLAWAKDMQMYIQSGDKEFLPRGVTFKNFRHHSQPDPMEGKGDPS